MAADDELLGYLHCGMPTSSCLPRVRHELDVVKAVLAVSLASEHASQSLQSRARARRGAVRGELCVVREEERQKD